MTVGYQITAGGTLGLGFEFHGPDDPQGREMVALLLGDIEESLLWQGRRIAENVAAALARIDEPTPAELRDEEERCRNCAPHTSWPTSSCWYCEGTGIDREAAALRAARTEYPSISLPVVGVTYRAANPYADGERAAAALHGQRATLARLHSSARRRASR